MAMMCEPASSSSSTVELAAIPLANASAVPPPSRSQSAACSASRVGLRVRE